jgi:hypothetical protein
MVKRITGHRVLKNASAKAMGDKILECNHVLKTRSMTKLENFFKVFRGALLSSIVKDAAKEDEDE